MFLNIIEFEASFQSSIFFLQLYTPLHAACASGQISVVRLLLEFGVELDAVTSHGNTSLHIVCLNGQDLVACELVANGATLDLPNNKGQVRR